MTDTTTAFPGGSVVKNPLANAGDLDLILGSGRSSGGRKGNPLQYSCLGNPMDTEAWRVTLHGVAKSQTQLSTYVKPITRTYCKHRTLLVLCGDLNRKEIQKGNATHSSILGLPLWLSWYRVSLQCGRPGFNSWVRQTMK